MQSSLKPTNNLVTPLCTDLYQITMAYGYWRCGKHNDEVVFDTFFRKAPFKGQYCIFAGSDEILRFVASFKYSESDIEYLKTILLNKEEAFWDWLASIDCSDVRVYCMKQGEFVFPREPIVVVEGPLAVVQLLETTILNLVNFACLVATNARRLKTCASQPSTKPRLRPVKPLKMLEFGLRRAQGPDGGYSASKYSFLGGFDASSNVICGKIDKVPIVGTMAHSFITSFTDFSQSKSIPIVRKGTSDQTDFVPFVLNAQEKVVAVFGNTHNIGELCAFASFAAGFPEKFIALVDSYDTLKSGMLNFFIVGLALVELGYAPIGLRLDSGDLAKLSIECRKMCIRMDAAAAAAVIFSDCNIAVSNDINEDSLQKMIEDGHEIDTYAVGTNLVTCQKQPALGCVYKLVEINNTPRIKLSEEAEKTTIPGKKRVYRLYGGTENKPLLDVLLREGEPVPVAGQRLLVRDPFDETARVYVTPTKVEPLLHLLWSKENPVIIPDLFEAKAYCQKNFDTFPAAVTRCVNAEPFRVGVSSIMYDHLHRMILENTPIDDLI
jgi:nicotinate phosphoribosyltransferase